MLTSNIRYSEIPAIRPKVKSVIPTIKPVKKTIIDPMPKIEAAAIPKEPKPLEVAGTKGKYAPYGVEWKWFEYDGCDPSRYKVENVFHFTGGRHKCVVKPYIKSGNYRLRRGEKAIHLTPNQKTRRMKKK
jgi:hypothetical protein